MTWKNGNKSGRKAVLDSKCRLRYGTSTVIQFAQTLAYEKEEEWHSATRLEPDEECDRARVPATHTTRQLCKITQSGLQKYVVTGEGILFKFYPMFGAMGHAENAKQSR